MRQALFIDPGDVHVGVAIFRELEDGWACTNTFECSPEYAEEFVERALANDTYQVICYERFKLFGHLAKQQIGSEFRASQLIGVIKYLHRRQLATQTKLVVQDPTAQAIGAALAKLKGIPLTSVTSRTGGHTKSAETHGFFYLGRHGFPLSVMNGKMEE